MKRMRKNIDALLDIIIIAVLVFTALVTIPSAAMRFMLAVVGCGAMFNNCKYLFDFNFKRRKNKNK
jgi:hypothetical protein